MYSDRQGKKAPMSILAAFAVPHPPLIIPTVGRGEERAIQNTIDAYNKVGETIAELAPELIIVSSPHATAYRDFFHISPGSHAQGSLVQFRSPSRIEVDYDEEFTTALSALCEQEKFPAGTSYERDKNLDHATFVPLWFINKFYTSYKIMRVGLSGLSANMHYHLGELINQTVEKLNRPAVYVASGDLSHKLLEEGPYGFAPEGPIFDEQITHMMDEGDFQGMLGFDESFCDRAAECGLRSFQIMAGALDGKKVKPKLLSYEGPFGVGYGVAQFIAEQ